MLFGKKWYWIAAYQNGQHVLLYPPYESARECRTGGFEKLQGVMFDVFESNSRDQGKATQQYRMTILDKSADKSQGLDESLRRMKHQL